MTAAIRILEGRKQKLISARNCIKYAIDKEDPALALKFIKVDKIIDEITARLKRCYANLYRK